MSYIETTTSARNQRRVLMVACAFPPIGGSGVQRSAKFAKYLPEFGWLPTVWAADRLNSMPPDPALLDDLPPEVTIHRRRRRGPLHRLQGAAHVLANQGGLASTLGRAIDWRIENWAKRHAVPDGSVRWARSSIRPLVRLIREQGVHAIYSTLSPASDHLLGLELKRRTNLPWVADFRDLWTDDYRYQEESESRRAAHRRLEQQVLEKADAVIGVSNRQTAILASHVPASKHKFLTITNGFDPDDFLNVDAKSEVPGERFVLSHIGRFDRWRIGEEWWNGLARFVERLGRDRRRFVLRMVGPVADWIHKRVLETGAEAELIGVVSHHHAVQEMRSADALWLAVPVGRNADTVIPAKLFEYLAARRPILVVGPRGGECEQVVMRCEAGLAVGADSTAISHALGTMFDRWKTGNPMNGCRESYLEPFSRVQLTRNLASVLDRVCGEHGMQGGVACEREARPVRCKDVRVEACSR